MRTAATIALVALLASGCGGDDQKKIVQSARSWTATIAIASRALEQNAIPSKLALQIAEEAERAVAQHLDQAQAPARRECLAALSAARHLHSVAAQR